MRKKTVFLILGAAVITTLGLMMLTLQRRWAPQGTASASADSLKATRVAMKWTFAGTMVPYFAAQQNGIFSRHKLAVELKEGGPGQPSSIQQVVLGNADFGITGAHDLAVARSQDQPVVAIGVIFKKSPVCLLSTADRRISKPTDLVGRTVEMTTGDNAEFEYLAMLRLAGVDPEDINQRPWPFNYQNLLIGRTDASVVYENDQAITLKPDVERQGKQISLLCPRSFGITPYADVLFTSETMLQQHPEWVAEFVGAFIESWEWTSANVRPAVDLFIRSPQLRGRGWNPDEQVAVVQKSIEFVRGTSDGISNGEHIEDIGIQETARWAETVELLRSHGRYEKLPTPEELFTNRWVNQHEMATHGSRGARNP